MKRYFSKTKCRCETLPLPPKTLFVERGFLSAKVAVDILRVYESISHRLADLVYLPVSTCLYYFTT